MSDKNEEKKSFFEILSDIASINFLEKIKEMWKEERKSFVSHVVIAFIFGILISGFIGTGILTYRKIFTHMTANPIYILYAYFRCMPYTLILTFVITCTILYFEMYFSRALGKRYEVDNEQNVKIAKNDGTYGNAHWMTETEKEKALYRSKDATKLKGPIIGQDKDGQLVARKPVQFTNGNTIIIGPPASAKSVGYVNNAVLQLILAGHSGVVVDTKGAVYKDLAYPAIKAGYDVKVFNIKPDEVEHSDAVHFLKTITNVRKAKGESKTITETIMFNTNSEKERSNVFYKCAYNLLQAMLLIVAFDNTIPKNERTLGKVYEILIECASYQVLEAKYSYLRSQRRHPAYESWSAYVGQRDVIRESGYSNLLASLNFMSDELIRQIVSNDEIDMVAPGYRKCLYFIIISDTDRTNNVLANLFIQSMYQQLCAAADSQESTGEMKLPVQVEFIVDEAKQVGPLPMYTEKLSSSRSRNINFTTIIQNNSQLEDMYGTEYATIIADCTTIIILAVGEPVTAKYFEDFMGTYTAFVDQQRYYEQTGDVIHVKNQYGVNEGKASRPLMYAAEIMGQGEKGLKKTELIVIFKGDPPLRLNKFMWWEHPVYKMLRLNLKSRKCFTKHHIPEWYKNFEFIEEDDFGYQAQTDTVAQTMKNASATQFKTFMTEVPKGGNSYQKKNSL